MNNKIIFILTAIVLAIGFAVATAVYNNENSSSVNTTNNIGLVEREGAPIKGSEDAKVTIVEFFDPACGTCAQFYPLVNKIIEKYPGKVKVMMRYAPLHQGSDQVVKMLEAAHKQGQFWPAVELLMANQNRWVINHVSQPVSAEMGLGQINLDRKKFQMDWQSAEVAAIVEKDIADGKALKVRATPEFFVNGKPMPRFGYEQLLTLVEEAIKDVY